MKNKNSHPVITLVKEWEIFEMEHPEGSLEDFCRNYLYKKQLNGDFSELKNSEPQNTIRAADGLSATLGRVNKYMHFYFRKSMQQLPLDNVEDWIYLMTLHIKGAMRKSELINQNISEFTSGTNVINRLLKEDLIKESIDPDDARSKLVAITNKGNEMVHTCLNKMIKASDLLWENVLTEKEQELAYYLLHKADNFHSSFFPSLRNLDVNQIEEKLNEEKNKN